MTCFLAMERSLLGVTVAPPQCTTFWADLKYLA